ncbi:hypothetical protein, partial [Streptomyces sp. NPDC127092]
MAMAVFSGLLGMWPPRGLRDVRFGAAVTRVREALHRRNCGTVFGEKVLGRQAHTLLGTVNTEFDNVEHFNAAVAEAISEFRRRIGPVGASRA